MRCEHVYKVGRLRFGKNVDPSETKKKENKMMIFLSIFMAKGTEDTEASLIAPVYPFRMK